MSEVQKKRKKAKRQPPPSQVCSLCRQLSRIVAGSNPRVCTECFNWPPEAKPEHEKTKGKGKRRD